MEPPHVLERLCGELGGGKANLVHSRVNGAATISKKY